MQITIYFLDVILLVYNCDCMLFVGDAIDRLVKIQRWDLYSKLSDSVCIYSIRIDSVGKRQHPVFLSLIAVMCLWVLVCAVFILTDVSGEGTHK